MESMSQEPDYESMSGFEQIKSGLEDSIAHARGQLSLRTTVALKPHPLDSAPRCGSDSAEAPDEP